MSFRGLAKPAFRENDPYLFNAKVPILGTPTNDMSTSSGSEAEVYSDGSAMDNSSCCSGTGISSDEEPTNLEDTLQQLMANTLELPMSSVGIEDNFFSLGGDSFIAMKLCAAARAIGMPLTVATILRHSTIEKMAKAMDLSSASDSDLKTSASTLMPFDLLQDSADASTIRQLAAEQCGVDESRVQDAYPCTPLQQGLLLQSLMQPGSYVIRHRWNVPATMEEGHFKQAWQAVYRAFDILRTRIVEGTDADLWQAVLHEDLQWSSQTCRDGMVDPFDAGLGYPLYRFALVPHLSGEGHEFSIEAHHAVLDGWTVNLLVDAFDRAYKGCELVPDHQFRHFVKYVQSGDVEYHGNFWREQLQNFERSSFNTDSIQDRTRSTTELLIPLDDFDRLPFTVSEYLRVAWAIAMCSHQSTEDIVFGIMEDGRDSPMLGIEAIAGPTIATVPVRIHFRSDASVSSLMESIRNQRVSMMPHRHFGLQNISDLSPGARSACDLHSILVVQPAFLTPDGTEPSLQHVSVEVSVDDCPLVLDCHLSDGAVRLHLDYACEYVSEMEASKTLSLMASVFNQIRGDSSTTCVGTLLTGGESVKNQTEEADKQLDLTGQLPAAAAQYWRDQLVSPPEIRSLATARTVNSARSAKTLNGVMDLSIADRIASIGPSLLYAAWVLTLSQYLESEEIVFGETSASASIVPRRVLVDREESINGFVKRLQEQKQATLPFESLDLHRIRDLSDGCRQACEFETALTIIVDSPAGVKSSIAVERPLAISCILARSTVAIDMTYDQSRIEPLYAQRILDHFQHILLQFSTEMRIQSGLKVGELNLLSSTDEQQVSQWNAGELATIDACIHEKVYAHVLSTPDATAIEAWDAVYTYRELDDLTTALAAYLIDSGIGERPIVPLCFDKSAWTVVCMLAVLKTGGSYVALDTSHPHDRLKLIIERTQAMTVLAAPKYAPLFGQQVNRVVVVGDALRKDLLARPTGYKLPATRPSDPALICFTSGSTGLPKGVILGHGAFCTLAASVSSEMQFSPSSRVLQFAGYAFDVSNSEIFLTLMHGGCCCIPTDYDRMNDLVGVVKRMGVNWLFLTPTVAGMVSPDDLGDVETWIFGGEAIRQDLIDRFAHRVHLVGAYGPAEGTIWPSITHFRPGSDSTNIGASGPGCYVWLVDPQDHNRLVPIGVIGEILLEGPMVAQGYLFDPEKTKAAFIEPPRWAAAPEGGAPRRFYKVGDLARQKPDGSLSFVGRRDTQVKLRGQRIELGEIEYRVSSNSENITGVAVDIVSLNRHSKALAAFFCPSRQVDVKFQDNIGSMTTAMREEIRELLQTLTKTLTSTMVPSYYIPLERLPTSPSRKLDRKKLQTYFESLSMAQRQEYHVL